MVVAADIFAADAHGFGYADLNSDAWPDIHPPTSISPSGYYSGSTIPVAVAVANVLLYPSVVPNADQHRSAAGYKPNRASPNRDLLCANCCFN